MDQVHVVRHKVLVAGQSIRAVARELGVSRNTVRKYLQEPAPRRRERPARPRPVMDRVAHRIDEILEEWRGRTTAKQRITGTRVWRQLRQEGFEVGVTTVRACLREKRRAEAEVFVPLVHRPGDDAQVDFFEVSVDVAGIRRKVWLFLLRLMYSARDFAWLYERCDQVALLDGHVRAFRHLGGVPRRGVYDNLRPAVKRIIRGAGRELQRRFLALASHYVFEPCFTRVGEGHDKGGVEGRGKGVRIQILTPIPRGESLAEISRQLLADLDLQAQEKKDAAGRTVLERHQEELSHLRPLPEHDFDPRRVISVSVDSKSLALVEGVPYSVPTRWADLEVTAYVGVDTVTLMYRGEEVVHDIGGRGERRVRYRHYLPELARKPQAVRQVAPELMAELGEPFGELWALLKKTYDERDAARAFTRILGAIVDHGEEEVKEALRKALAADRMDLLDLGGRLRALEPVKEVAVPQSLACHQIESPDLSRFDLLLKENYHE